MSQSCGTAPQCSKFLQRDLAFGEADEDALQMLLAFGAQPSPAHLFGRFVRAPLAAVGCFNPGLAMREARMELVHRECFLRSAVWRAGRYTGYGLRTIAPRTAVRQSARPRMLRLPPTARVSAFHAAARCLCILKLLLAESTEAPYRRAVSLLRHAASSAWAKQGRCHVWIRATQ